MRFKLSSEKVWILKQNTFLCQKMKSDKKQIFSEKKNPFWTKINKLRFFFQKKGWILFSFKFTSTIRKVILKFYLKSYKSIICIFDIFNASKPYILILARLRIQNHFLTAKNARILDFLKMARLKAVNTTWVLTWEISSKDPKVTWV